MTKLMHQPFESWLLSEEPLTSEQNQALQEHLRTCATCRQVEASWAEIDQLFHASSQVAPTSGFTARWQERLELERRDSQQRQTWFVLAFTAAAASLLFFLLSAQALQLLRSPSQLVLFVVYRLLNLLSLAETTENFLVAFIRTVPGLLPLPVWILSAGVLCILGTLWVVFYQALTSRRIRV